jgi:hypothetical protein
MPGLIDLHGHPEYNVSAAGEPPRTLRLAAQHGIAASEPRYRFGRLEAALGGQGGRARALDRPPSTSIWPRARTSRMVTTDPSALGMRCWDDTDRRVICEECGPKWFIHAHQTASRI